MKRQRKFKNSWEGDKEKNNMYRVFRISEFSRQIFHVGTTVVLNHCGSAVFVDKNDH